MAFLVARLQTSMPITVHPFERHQSTCPPALSAAEIKCQWLHQNVTVVVSTAAANQSYRHRLSGCLAINSLVYRIILIKFVKIKRKAFRTKRMDVTLLISIMKNLIVPIFILPIFNFHDFHPSLLGLFQKLKN